MKVIFFILVFLFCLPFLVQAISFNSQASVTVNPIYSLDIEIDIQNKRILFYGGNIIDVDVEVGKTDLTNISEEIEVDLYYELKKRWFWGTVLVSSGPLDSMLVQDYNMTNYDIVFPFNTGTGIMTLTIEASHPQSRGDYDSDIFFRMRSRDFIENTNGFGGVRPLYP